MTLHRRIIRSLSAIDEPALRLICRQAASARLESAMKFVQSLRPQHLQSFWYSASKYNFALIGTFISLLWATSTEKEEAATYRAKLDEYRWMLRLSSKSADFMDHALNALATSTGVLVSAIPEQPDPVKILNRYQIRALPDSTQNHHPSEETRPASIIYRSESEDQIDMSPTNLIDQFSSDLSPAAAATGTIVVGWTEEDHLWDQGFHGTSAIFETDLRLD